MLGLHTADIVVLITYFIGITIIGAWAARMVKNMGDFFMPRTFGKTMLVTHAFGTGTHSDQAVGVAAKTFTSGLELIVPGKSSVVGFAISWVAAGAMIFGFFLLTR